MSCSTFRMDGKCPACCCSAPPFPYPLGFTWMANPAATTGPAATPGQRAIKCSGWTDKWKGWGQSEAVEKRPHPPHQYCSLAWWKLTRAGIFHRVIGREDQMPWPDTLTLLPVQMMTHSSLHYSWLLQMRGRSQWKATDVQEFDCQQVGRVQEVRGRWMLAPATTDKVERGSPAEPPKMVSSVMGQSTIRCDSCCTGHILTHTHGKHFMVIKTATHNFMLVNCCL